ncbi:MAG TPA: hypothetical protein VEG64_15395 [Candidatus Sulfotelmatobacter sp.]|nr:hypothetical protein [Candidatus Sulfotelmatobacter sp.]
MDRRMGGKDGSGRLPHWIWVAAWMIAAAVSGLGIAAAGARADGYGYSYMRLVIGGQPVINLVHDSRYQGWLQVEAVRAAPRIAIKKLAGGQSPADGPSTAKKGQIQWTTLPKILVSGRAGAGEIRFGAGELWIGDERKSSLSPLMEAQDKKTVIESAELDLYNEDGGAFIGKYRLKGIRVLSLEDVPASACAMWEVTLSFQSVEKI